MNFQECFLCEFVYAKVSRLKVKDEKENTNVILSPVAHNTRWFQGLACLYSTSDMTSMNRNMSMEHWWNDGDRAKRKYLQTNRSQCHFAHNKSHTAWDRILHFAMEGRKANNYRSQSTAKLQTQIHLIMVTDSVHTAQ